MHLQCMICCRTYYLYILPLILIHVWTKTLYIKIFQYYKSKYNSASTHMFAKFKSFKLILLPSMQNTHTQRLYIYHSSPTLFHLISMKCLRAYTLIHKKGNMRFKNVKKTHKIFRFEKYSMFFFFSSRYHFNFPTLHADCRVVNVWVTFLNQS